MAIAVYRSNPLSTPLSRRRALALAAASAGLLAFRPALAARQDGDTIRVTTTVGMVADAVRNNGGEHVDATALMGPGIDTHRHPPAATYT